MKAKDKKFEDIKIGNSASFVRIITEDDLVKFSEISGDYNPLHLNKKYASKTEFKDRIVYGMFMASLVSRLVGMELPGKKSLLLKECMEFKKPARVGDRLMVKGRVVHKSHALRLIELTVEIFADKKLLALGSVHVRVLK